jgi:hypothetical protein
MTGVIEPRTFMPLLCTVNLKTLTMKNQIAIGGLILSLIFTGCVGSGVLISTNTTQVQLSQPNYKIVATNVAGHAKTGYLFGASLGVGMYSQAYALIPLQKDRGLYKIAMEDLWKNFEAKNGKTDGRSLALVNLRYDSEALNTGIYTSPELTITADVIEFQK